MKKEAKKEADKDGFEDDLDPDLDAPVEAAVSSKTGREAEDRWYESGNDQGEGGARPGAEEVQEGVRGVMAIRYRLRGAGLNASQQHRHGNIISSPTQLSSGLSAKCLSGSSA